MGGLLGGGLLEDAEGAGRPQLHLVPEPPCEVYEWRLDPEAQLVLAGLQAQQSLGTLDIVRPRSLADFLR
jgi:hypothetical protein